MTYRPLTSAVTADIALHCDDEQGRPMAFMATFAYEPLDPWAVRVVLHLPGLDVPWVVARSLLVRGLGEPAGEGTVRLRPGVDEDGRALVHLVFHAREGRLRADVRAAELLAFLSRTWLAVRPGEESADVDGFLADVLR